MSFLLKNLKNSTVAPLLLIQSGGVALWQFKYRAEPLQLYCRIFPFYTERQWRTVSLCSLRRTLQTFSRTVQSYTARQCRTVPFGSPRRSLQTVSRTVLSDTERHCRPVLICSPRQYKKFGFLNFCFRIFKFISLPVSFSGHGLCLCMNSALCLLFSVKCAWSLSFQNFICFAYRPHHTPGHLVVGLHT